MSMPSASGGIDWAKVDKLAKQILAEKAKDLLVASYLAVAQIHINKVEGFVTGLTIYRDLLAHHWEGLYPTKKRKKGRVAAIEWWIEKSQSALEGIQSPALPPEKIEEYRKIVQEVDELLKGCLDDAPLLRPLERFIDNLPVKSQQVAEEKSTPVSAEEPAPKKAAPAQSQQPPAAQPGEVGSEADADKVAREAFKMLRRAADFFHTNDLANPKGYRWRRIAGWSMIQAIPPHTDKQTEIPPPVDREGFEQTLTDLKEKGSWEALIRTAEERFEGALLWLDLTRYTAEALESLGKDYFPAWEAVCQETAYFIQRVPGIETLSYADGSPFSDHETRQWLKGIRLAGESAEAVDGPASGAGQGAESDAMAETLARFQSLAKKRGKLAEAVDGLQQEMRNAFSRRERLLWRMGLVEAIMNAKKGGLVRPQLDAILDEIDTYRLEEWDPVLAVKGLRVAWFGLNACGDKSDESESASVLSRLARLDPAEGIRLAKK
jgi:type VI secretion system protein VasJ